MEESNLRKCKKCGELKTRTLDGQFNARDKRYKDETGKLWSGNYCPPCNVERVRLSMQKKRSGFKDESES